MRRCHDAVVGLGFLWCGLLVAIVVQCRSTDAITTTARQAVRWWLQAQPGDVPLAETIVLPAGIRSLVQLDARRELRAIRGEPMPLAAWTPLWDQALRSGTVVERERAQGEWWLAMVQYGAPPTVPQGYIGLHLDATALPWAAVWPAWGLAAAGLVLSGAYLWWCCRVRSSRCASATPLRPGDAAAISPGLAASEWPGEYTSILCVADTVSHPVIVCDAQWRCAGANAAARGQAIQEHMHLLDWSRQLSWGQLLIQTLRAVTLPGPRSTHVATEAVSLSVARLDRGSDAVGYWISWEEARA